MIIYIAGPITGHLNYRTKFKKAERRLMAMGHIVINPSYLPNGLKEYMPICKAMIDQADAIFFLHGFETSIGSMEEYDYAKINKMAIFFEDKKS